MKRLCDAKYMVKLQDKGPKGFFDLGPALPYYTGPFQLEVEARRWQDCYNEVYTPLSGISAVDVVPYDATVYELGKPTEYSYGISPEDYLENTADLSS